MENCLQLAIGWPAAGVAIVGTGGKVTNTKVRGSGFVWGHYWGHAALAYNAMPSKHEPHGLQFVFNV